VFGDLGELRAVETRGPMATWSLGPHRHASSPFGELPRSGLGVIASASLRGPRRLMSLSSADADGDA
jgi:hypothetical protein